MTMGEEEIDTVLRLGKLWFSLLVAMAYSRSSWANASLTLHPMNQAIRIALVALALWTLSSCRTLRKHSPWEVYRSANV